MYGLTDNIVAGPAGHTTAGPAGSFMAGPAGSVTPAPAGHTPVYPVTSSIPYSGGGYVPIDTSPARIPYAPPGAGIVYMSGSTGAPIPGPSASVPIGPATQGGLVSGGGGFIGGGGGFVGGGGGSISGAGGGGISGAGGGGISGAGGGPVSGAGGGAVSGGPGQASAGMAYVTHNGTGIAPVELRVGQAMGFSAPGLAPTAATGEFTVSPAGRTPSIPAGSVQPFPATHFHAPQSSHVAHHPQDTQVHTLYTEPYQAYKAPYVWEPQRVDFGQAILASDTLRSWSYDTPHVLFPDERPALVYEIEIAARPSMQVNEISNQTVNLDMAQPRSVTNETSFPETRNLTLDNSITRNVSLSMPEIHETTVNNDVSQHNSTDNSVTNQRIAQTVVEAPARILNMVFIDAPQPPVAAAQVGAGIMARVA